MCLRYQVGDANYHAMVVLMLSARTVERWKNFPYTHNTNDDPTYTEKNKLWHQTCLDASAAMARSRNMSAEATFV